MPVVRTGLIVIATLAGSPALAQALPGSTVGLTATGLPADPFASNYPSEPPPQVQRERPYGSARRGPPVRQIIKAPRSTQRLRPPADIPGGRPGR